MRVSLSIMVAYFAHFSASPAFSASTNGPKTSSVSCSDSFCFSPQVAQLLARFCDSSLYILEISAFLQGQSQASGYQMHKPLTKREQAVLSLLFRRYDQETIATELSITRKTVSKHLEHIYEKLGVHNEQDALLAAYSAGLFSPLEEFSS